MQTQRKPIKTAADTIGESPPGAESRTSAPGKESARHKKLTGKSYSTGGLRANGNLKQSEAEVLVQRYATSTVRDDAWIPFCLRTLEQAERELRHDGLALAISAAEWNYCDLVIWQSYSPQFARAEAWKHIGIGIAWIRCLRRNL